LKNLLLKKKKKELFIFVDDEMELEEKSTNSLFINIDTYENYSSNFEYSQTIFEHLRKTEAKYRPDPQYLFNVQNEISVSMRTILIDWMCEVAQEYKLVDETLYLGVNMVDRYLSKKYK